MKLHFRNLEPITIWASGILIFFVLSITLGFAAITQYRIWESGSPTGRVTEAESLGWQAAQTVSELERAGWLVTAYLQSPDVYGAPLSDQLAVLTARSMVLGESTNATELSRSQPALFNLLRRVQSSAQHLYPTQLTPDSAALIRSRIEELRPIARELVSALRSTDLDELRSVVDAAYNQRTFYLVMLALSIAVGLIATNLILKQAQMNRILRETLTKSKESTQRSLSLELRNSRDLRRFVSELMVVERHRLDSFELIKKTFDVNEAFTQELDDENLKLSFAPRLSGLSVIADREKLLLAVHALVSVSSSRGLCSVYVSRTNDSLLVSISDAGPEFPIGDDLWRPMSPEAMRAGDMASSHAAAYIIITAHGGSCHATRDGGRNCYVIQVPLTVSTPVAV